MRRTEPESTGFIPVHARLINESSGPPGITSTTIGSYFIRPTVITPLENTTVLVAAPPSTYSTGIVLLPSTRAAGTPRAGVSGAGYGALPIAGPTGAATFTRPADRGDRAVAVPTT